MTYYDYDNVWNAIVQVQNDPELTTYPGAFVDWDNTARYKQRATIFPNANPEKFEYWFEQLVKSMPGREIPEPFIFLNAWNEWAESTYLEPDENYGFGYLEAVKRTLMHG